MMLYQLVEQKNEFKLNLNVYSVKNYLNEVKRSFPIWPNKQCEKQTILRSTKNMFKIVCLSKSSLFEKSSRGRLATHN
jgi:hypothetical protein